MGLIEDMRATTLSKTKEDNIALAETEANEAGFVDTLAAAVNTNIVGASKFSNMVANKHMLYDNVGDDNYYKTPEFAEKTKDISIEDRIELYDVKNPRLLDQRMANQARYHRDIKILDDAGAGGIALELGASLFDPVSWVVGGGVFKGFKLAETALNVQGKALTALQLAGSSVAAASAGGVSEALIQSSSDINDNERLNNVIGYSAALGLGIPAVLNTLKGMKNSKGNHSAVANALSEGTTNKSWTARFAVSTSEQLRAGGTSDFARDLGDKAVTPAKAFKDTEGNFIVKSDDTAMDVRQEVVEASVIQMEKNVHLRAKENKVDTATQAKMDGELWNKFTNQVEQDVRSRMGKMSDEEIFGIYEKQTGKKVDESTEDLFDVVGSTLSREGFDSGKYLAPKDLGYVSKFYGDFGTRATKIELGGISGKDSRGYGHIKYNQQFILSDVAGAISKFRDMLNADNINKSLIAKGELSEEEIGAMAERLVEKALDRDMSNRYLSKGTGGATSATKRRKLRLDRSLHADMFVNDISIIASEYADNIGGKIAMKEVYGLQADKSGSILGAMEDVYKKIIKEGRANNATERAIKRDVENTKAIFETVLGTRKFAKEGGAQTVGRLGKKASNALYSAGFVLYGLVEPWVSVARHGLGNTISATIPAFKQMKELTKNVKPNDPLVKMLEHAGVAGQTMRGIKYDRYDNHEIAPTSGRAEMFLDKASHYSRKYSGFNYVNDISDILAGGAAMSDLFRIAASKGKSKGVAKADASKLARYGIFTKDLDAIHTEKAIIRDKVGKVTDYNFPEWRNQDLAKSVQRYLQRAVTDTIMRSDGTRVHRWQSDVNNPLLNLGLQYTQMPTALYERLIYNGFDEINARTAVGIIGSMASMYMILSLENEVSRTLGGKVQTEDELLTKAITRIPFVGILPNVYDYAAILTGNENSGGFMGRDVSQFGGAGMGVANKVFRAVQGLGDGLDDKDVKNFMKLAPIINSMPLVKSAFDKGLREVTE